MKKVAWALSLKDEFNDSEVPQYYADDEDLEITEDLSKANIINDKDAAEDSMKKWEKFIFEKYGKNAICNAGFTHMMKHFEWVEVEVEELEGDSN